MRCSFSTSFLTSKPQGTRHQQEAEAEEKVEEQEEKEEEIEIKEEPGKRQDQARKLTKATEIGL